MSLACSLLDLQPHVLYTAASTKQPTIVRPKTEIYSLAGLGKGEEL